MNDNAAPPQDDDAQPQDRARIGLSGSDGFPAPTARALRLTRWGLWWEASIRAFWPLLTLAGCGVAALSLGLVEALPVALQRITLWGLAGLLLAALLWGLWRFRRPRREDAWARLDESLPGRPLTALRDTPALGTDGALWQAHLAQMAARAAAARPVPPDAQLTRRDPFALRLAGLTAAVMALLFGSAGNLGQGLAALAPLRPLTGVEPTAPTGPGWEGWAEPPPYTRKPTLYLNAQPQGAVLDLPKGSTISLRLYGDTDAVTQDIGTPLPTEGQDRAPRFRVEQNGSLTIAGTRFDISVRPDAAPSVTLGPAAERRADGRLVQTFAASDDYGVTEGQAHITLDLDRVPRRFGLATPPEPRDELRVALPLPGVRPQVEGQLSADLKKHPWANLPVRLELRVTDGIGQTGSSSQLTMDLPGRRFFDPLAAALIELRRDLLWSRQNAPQAARLLRAILWQPQDLADPATLRDLRAVSVGLAADPMTDLQRDALAEGLWRIAEQIEDGGLADALERMRRAQERLSQAMKRGASADEIRELMEELRRATDDYLDRLAEQGENDPSDRFNRGPAQMLSGDQIQQMMDDIQRLMNEGRMAEAQALLDQFNRMMENMQVRRTEGEGQGESSSDRMARTLREQQDLADRTFRQMQDDWMGLGEPSPDQGGAGQEGGEQAGEDGAAGGGDPGPGGAGAEDGGSEGAPGSGSQASRDPQDMADEQSILRDDLGMQRGLLPERGSEQGDAAGQAMDRAGRAMQQAERALRQGDMAEAMDRQAEAIESLREGIRALGRGDRRAGPEGGEDGQGQGQQADAPSGQPGEGQARDSRSTQRRDPLGRALQGLGGGIATDDSLGGLEDGDTRARELQDEIRRRLGDRDRPQIERDYLDRLIDRF